ncbi:MAG: hypothetical protein H7X97_11955 [Opitutaceae bacterium]|nr:hypothetical protein [Verrucomicrobiales bacterium]
MNWTLLQNSLLVSAGTTCLAVTLGWVAALALGSSESRWRWPMLGLSAVALILPPFLVTNTWLHYLGLTGVWRDWLPINILSLGGTIGILTLMLWPVTTLFTLAAWNRLEVTQLEAEPFLQGGKLIQWILWPLARPAVVSAAMLTFLLALNQFAVPAILQVKVFPAELWVSFNTTFDYRAAIQLGWPLVVIPLILLIALRRRSWSWDWQKAEPSSRLLRQRLGVGWVAGSVVFLMILIGLSTLLPVGQLITTTRTWTELKPAWLAGQSALAHSAGFAVMTSLCVVLAGLLSWRRRLEMAAWMIFLIPGVLLGIGLIWILNRPGLSAFYQSVGVVVLAYTIRFFAVGWSGASQAMLSVDRSLIDAIRLEGASRWQQFRIAVLPQVWMPLAATGYVVFLLCLWDVETLVLIVPPGRETLSLRVFNLLHYGHNDQVNALCLLLLLLGIAPLVLFALTRIGRRTAALAMTLFTCGGLVACKPADSIRQVARQKDSLFSGVEVIGSRGTGVGQFNKPRSIAVDREDNIYVVDMTGRVQKFSPDGRALLAWQMPQTDLGKPKGMSCDAEGRVVLIEPHYSRVNHFFTDGSVQWQWGQHGTNDGQLAFPRAVAINAQGDYYVSEYGIRERVQRFTRHGAQFAGSFGRRGNGPGEFDRAEGIGVDAQGRIYVADSCNHRIQVFSPDGVFLRTYGRAGSGRGELSYPYDVRVDAEGRQYVCEFGNSRVQIFDARDQPIEIVGGAGGGAGQLSNPWSIALDSKGNLYVADAMNHRVQKFTRKPQPARVGSAPTATDGVRRPDGGRG